MNFKRIVGLIMLACLVGLFPAAVSAGDSEYVNPAVPGKDHPVFWLDRGGLYATYGNYKAAVQAFKQALELAPDSAEAHFGLALAYVGLDDYDQAMVHFDQALMRGPQQGIYYYGRARALLLNGRKAQAAEDFQKAADLGHMDAVRHLQP
jgi:tetratricopeptide (TPR) repeat protein